MPSMQYAQQHVHDHAVARFGDLETSLGSFELPAASPGLRTGSDVAALLEDIRHGLRPQVISPYASTRRITGPALVPLLRPEPGTVSVPRPLVIPDPESEALNLNCNARSNYKKLGSPGAAVGLLLETGFTGDPTKGRHEVHAAWRTMERQFGLAPLVSWIGSQLAGIGSDVLSIPTPIIRADPRTAKAAMDVGRNALAIARTNPAFLIYGVHLLIHAEVFQPTSQARLTREALINEVRSWYTRPTTQGIVLSVKIYDPSNVLTDPSHGSVSRRFLSDTLMGLQEGVRNADGLFVIHNVGNWLLGMLDSGADVASFRVSGPMKIDVPIQGKAKRGPRPTPPLMMLRAMVHEDPTSIRRAYEATGAFPVPACVSPEPYWDLKPGDKSLYSARMTCGVLVEAGQEYRDAGLDPTIPLAEALRSRVDDAGNRQELLDLCPTLA